MRYSLKCFPVRFKTGPYCSVASTCERYSWIRRKWRRSTRARKKITAAAATTTTCTQATPFILGYGRSTSREQGAVAQEMRCGLQNIFQRVIFRGLYPILKLAARANILGRNEETEVGRREERGQQNSKRRVGAPACRVYYCTPSSPIKHANNASNQSWRSVLRRCKLNTNLTFED